MTFAFFAVLIPLVASILTKLMHSSSNLMLADASFAAIEKMLAENPLTETKKLPVPQNGEIRLDHVSFQYEAGVKALDDVSLTIRPGTVTALVGESGGEMQRIALARAILKDAPIVLLDEATAFADAENEYLIQRALDILLHGKTVLMIAHRLQTIVHADQIIVMQRGGIAEQGTHEELMQRQGVYAKMYHEYENIVSWKIGGRA